MPDSTVADAALAALVAERDALALRAAVVERDKLRAALDEAFIVFVDTQWARAYAHLSPGREDESVAPAKERE